MLAAGSVPMNEIRELIEEIGFDLPTDYIEFVLRYGGAIVGPYTVFGLRAAPAMAVRENSAIEVTKRFRQEGWSETENWLVISKDHAGNPIGLDHTGKIWRIDHDGRVVECLAENFEQFLSEICLARSD